MKLLILILLIIGHAFSLEDTLLTKRFKSQKALLEKITKQESWSQSDLIFTQAHLSAKPTKNVFIFHKKSCGRGVCKVYLISFIDKSHKVIGIFNSKPTVLDEMNNGKKVIQTNSLNSEKDSSDNLVINYFFNGEKYVKENK